MEDEKCMCRVEKRKAMKKMKCLNDPEDERMQREKAWMEMIMIIQKQQQQQQEEEEEYEYLARKRDHLKEGTIQIKLTVLGEYFCKSSGTDASTPIQMNNQSHVTLDETSTLVVWNTSGLSLGLWSIMQRLVLMEQHAILSTVFVILVETIALFGYSDDYETSREQGNLRLSETDSNRKSRGRTPDSDADREWLEKQENRETHCEYTMNSSFDRNRDDNSRSHEEGSDVDWDRMTENEETQESGTEIIGIEETKISEWRCF
ncbi:hypothetical protein JHK85_034812 [Glycine max]|nr:hypothetical protein JHK85_034812 [Glycine max]